MKTLEVAHKQRFHIPYICKDSALLIVSVSGPLNVRFKAR